MAYSGRASAPTKRVPPLPIVESGCGGLSALPQGRCQLSAHAPGARRGRAHSALGGCRDFPHPSQRRHIGFGVNDQQRIELAELFRCRPAEQGLVGLLARSGTASNARTLDP